MTGKRKQRNDGQPAQDQGRGPLITVTTAAALLEITPRQVQRLAQSGYIPKGSKGEYHLADVVRGYIKSLKDTFEEHTKKAGRSRADAIREEEAEYRLNILRHQYMKVDDAFAVYDDMVGPMRVDLEALPAAATRDMAIRLTLEELIAGILTKAANRRAAAAKAQSSDSDALAPDDEDDA